MVWRGWVEWTRQDENGFYADVGCPDIGIPSCFTCPLAVCRHCLPPKQAGVLMREARLRQLLGEGHSLEEAADIMGVSRRTAFRLKKGNAQGRLPVVGKT